MDQARKGMGVGAPFRQSVTQSRFFWSRQPLADPSCITNSRLPHLSISATPPLPCTSKHVLPCLRERVAKLTVLRTDSGGHAGRILAFCSV